MSNDDSEKGLGDMTEEEVEEVLLGMVAKGLLEIVGQDENGKNLYQHTALGKAAHDHMDSDPKDRN